MCIECFSPKVKGFGIVAAQAFEAYHAQAEEGEEGNGFADARDVAAGEDVLGHPVFGLLFLGIHVEDGVEEEEAARFQEAGYFIEIEGKVFLSYMFEHADGYDFIELILIGIQVQVVFQDHIHFSVQSFFMNSFFGGFVLLFGKSDAVGVDAVFFAA